MDEDVIKSAREIAMEKIEKLGQATEEERLNWKLLPLGEALGGKYLRDDSNMLSELSKYQGKEQQVVIRGAADVLLRNIGLPKNDVEKKKNKKAMDGIKLLKSDKVAVEIIFSKLRYLLTHYEEQGAQQREQAYQQLKDNMEDRIMQALQKQAGGAAAAAGKIDVEKQPQFQQEWRKLQGQLDSAYIVHLNDYKKELAAIA